MLKIDSKKSIGLFDSDIKDILKYLKQKGIKSESYLEFLKKTGGGYIQDNTINIKGEVYSVDMLLGKSSESIYDLEKCNKLMNIDNSKFIAIGSLIGDDLIGMIPNNDSIYFCSLDDQNCESLIKISDSFDSFLKMVK